MQISVSHGHLEAQLRPEDGPLRGAAVVCHPHPLHGGTMHTKAVFRTAQALNSVGIRALRFNFRGVGHSTGSYDDGMGEQEDVKAALDFLETQTPGVPLFLAGFSFGSIVGLRVAQEDPRVRACLGLGLPLASYDFSFLAELNRPVRIVQGEEDQFGSGAAVAEFLKELGPHISLVRIPKSDHFFHDRFPALQEAVSSFFLPHGPAAHLLLADDSPRPAESEAS
ncbi:MAG: alpha/beta fold hydrolase [Gemmatimonadota bacterium]